MVKPGELSSRRILILAIAVSLVWHLFWLSTVKIVSGPVRREAVKFSKVSFLGPILSGISMDLRAAPASRSFLERRYRAMTAAAFSRDGQPGMGAASKHDADAAPSKETVGGFSLAIDDAVSGEKLECDYPAE
jgi:hypothetical protein